MSTEITKKEIAEKLQTILNSSRVLGAEGLAVDLEDLLERINKDL